MNLSRHPSEVPILILTIIGIAALLLLTSVVSLCLVPVVVLIMVAMAYAANKNYHQQVMQTGQQVTPQSAPELYAIVERCRQRLNAPPVEVYVVNNRERNAYTFGLSTPNVIVLHSSLLRIMDADELAFVIGHEMGHVVFSHTWLNTLIGGMAGIPMPFGAAIVLTLVFRVWSRACEYSSDRAGLVACGRLDKAVQALVEIVAGDVNNPAQIQQVLQVLNQQDEQAGSILGEFLSTHPLIAKRIKELKEFNAEQARGS